MRRRAFIGGLAGAAVIWPRAALAQQARRLPVIGFLNPGFTPHPSLAGTPAGDNLREGLRKAGYVDGDTCRLEARYGQGKPETLVGFAEELVRLKVDVIVAIARPSIEAAKAATRDIPIVALDMESDPVASGYIASFAAPGGNITGLFMDAPGLTGKWLQQVREAVPDARRVAVLWDVTTGEYGLRALRAAAKANAVDLHVLEFRGVAGLESALVAGLKEGPQALIQLGSPLVTQLANRIADIATTYRMPAIAMFRQFPDSGGLMSYGPVLPIWYQLLGTRYVAAILKGARPADLPVDRPSHFEFVLNMKTAAALGLRIPVGLLAQADVVIE
jgi:putative tryptophan/tyrosine transport system substrate-binding protein